MHIRIDPVAGDAPIRLLRVESIEPHSRDAAQGQPEPEPHSRDEAQGHPEPSPAGATYAPSAAADTGAYAPAADAPKSQPLLPPSPAAVLAVLKPVSPSDEEERSLYPSGTPAWMTALLKA
jgi:hypothetical protein